MIDYTDKLKKQEDEVHRCLWEYERKVATFSAVSQQAFALQMLGVDPNLEKKIGKRRLAIFPAVARTVDGGKLAAAKSMIDAFEKAYRAEAKFRALKRRAERGLK